MRPFIFIFLALLLVVPSAFAEAHLSEPPYRTITKGSLYVGSTHNMFDYQTSTYAQGNGAWVVNLTWDTDWVVITGVDLYILGVNQGIVISDTNGTSFSYPTLTQNAWQNKTFNPPLKGRTITYQVSGWTQTGELLFRTFDGIPTVSYKILFMDTSTQSTSWNWTATNIIGNNTEFIFSTSQNPIFNLGVGNWKINLTASNFLGSNTTTQFIGFNLSSPKVYFWNRTG